MSQPRFEEQYEDVLQNIEFAILRIFREKPVMTDYEVQSALEALIKTYQGEASGRQPVLPRNPLAAEVYQSVQAMCEWRLGRSQTLDEKNRPVTLTEGSLSVEEILACLKRIRKSVETWTKRNGRQGYLQFVNQFIL